MTKPRSAAEQALRDAALEYHRAPAHILTPSATVRRVVNMTALAVADPADAAQVAT